LRLLTIYQFGHPHLMGLSQHWRLMFRPRRTALFNFS